MGSPSPVSESSLDGLEEKEMKERSGMKVKNKTIVGRYFDRYLQNFACYDRCIQNFCHYDHYGLIFFIPFLL